MASMKTLITLILISGLLTACTPTRTTRGNMVEDFRMEDITVGISTQTNVLKSLGSPTTKAPFDDNVWYYIGQKMKKKGIFDDEVVDERVIVVAFDDKGIVQKMEDVDAERLEIPKSRDKTYTGGNDVSAVEQLLGNIGRFNNGGGDGNAARTAGGGTR